MWLLACPDYQHAPSITRKRELLQPEGPCHAEHDAMHAIHLPLLQPLPLPPKL
jgi:hypothetical protein